MDTPTKDEAAERLARAHFEIDSGVTRIYRLVRDEQESDPGEPIRLLEVSEYAIPSGLIPLRFPSHPSSGQPYAAEIVQIAPEELELVRTEQLMLPEGWRIDQEYCKPSDEQCPTT